MVKGLMIKHQTELAVALSSRLDQSVSVLLNKSGEGTVECLQFWLGLTIKHQTEFAVALSSRLDQIHLNKLRG